MTRETCKVRGAESDVVLLDVNAQSRCRRGLGDRDRGGGDKGSNGDDG